MDHPQVSTADRKTHLYRIFSATDELLYVGISLSAVARLSQHAKEKPWWDEARMITVEHLPNRSVAQSAEQCAIREERPKYNVHHNHPDPPAAPAPLPDQWLMPVAPGLPPKQWLTPDEAAHVLGVGRTRLFEMLRSGRLKSSSLGRRTRRIHVADLIAFSDALTT